LQKETRYALDVAEEKPEGTIFIAPVRLEECSVPERLSKYQWVDLYNSKGYKALEAALGIGQLPADTRTILVVEEEPATRKITKILLESWGYAVLVGVDAFDAIKLYYDNLAGIGLILTATELKGLTGLQLAKIVSILNPKVPILLVHSSAFAYDETDLRRYPVLRRPFSPAALAKAVRDAFVGVDLQGGA
jgi:CheY-like chemotaxis protein